MGANSNRTVGLTSRSIVIIFGMLFIISIRLGAAEPDSGFPLGFGFCDAPGNPAESEIFENLGARYVRMGVNWDKIEVERGVWDYSRYDSLIQTSVAAGRKVILMLCYESPVFYPYYDGKRRITAEQIPDFLRYVQAVLDRWGPVIAGLEVWNEPNLGIFWEGTDREFFDFTRRTVAYIKSVAPLIPVAVGSVQLSPWVGGPSFVRRLLDSGAMDQADALSIHPYGYWVPTQARRVARARADMDERGFEDRQLWITEVGYPTKTLYPHRVPSRKQPLWVSEALIRLSSAGANIITWYHLYTTMEEERRSAAFDVASFALLYREPDGRYISKNGLDSWRRVARALGGCVPSPDALAVDKKTGSSAPAASLEIFHYSGDEGYRVLCLWGKDEVQEFVISGPATPIDLTDAVSGEQTLLKPGDVIRVGRNPLMLRYDAGTGIGTGVAAAGAAPTVRFTSQNGSREIQLGGD